MAMMGATPHKDRRRRRRRQDKPPVAARLVLDDQVKGDVGVVADDLFRELFPRGKRNPASQPANVRRPRSSIQLT